MFSQFLVAFSFLVSIPDTSTRTHAWRVVDTYDPIHECALACTSPSDPDRDTTCIQAAIAKGIVDRRYNATELPPGACYINATLEVYDTAGYTLYGHGAGTGGLGRRTVLYWASATPADPVLHIADVRDSVFRDFQIEPDNLRTIQTGVSIDNCASCFLPEQGSYSSNTPTANVFERVAVQAPSGGQTLYDGFVVEAGTDSANNDFHRFQDTRVLSHHGDAYRIESTQHKHIMFENATCLSNVSYLENTTCVNSWGCFSFNGGGGGYHTYYDFYVPIGGCPSSISNAGFEGSKKFVYYGGNNGNWLGLSVTASRWSSNSISTGATGTDREFVFFGYSGASVWLANMIGEQGNPKPLVFRFVGGGFSSGHTLMGNFIASSLTPSGIFTYHAPVINVGNVHWSSSGQTTSVSLGSPITNASATATPYAYEGIVGASQTVNINTSATAITNLLNGAEGQTITLWCNGCTRTVTHNANIYLNGDKSFPMTGDSKLTLRYLNGIWREISRSTGEHISYLSTTTQTLAGDVVGAVETAYSNLSQTIPANTLLAGDQVRIVAAWRVTSVNGALHYTPKIRVNNTGTSSATGTLLCSDGPLITMDTATNAFVECTLKFHSVGATSNFDAVGGTNYVQYTPAASFAINYATNVPLYIVPTVVYSGGVPSATDQVEMRFLNVSILRE